MNKPATVAITSSILIKKDANSPNFQGRLRYIVSQANVHGLGILRNEDVGNAIFLEVLFADENSKNQWEKEVGVQKKE